jgi:hypothetical protein
MADHSGSDSSPSKSLFRRSVSLPLRPADSKDASRGSPSTGPQVETLYVHPSARIVSFTAAPPSRPNKSAAPSLEEEAGTLQWTSTRERVMAVGTLSNHYLLVLHVHEMTNSMI